jgi:hypothetical protein
MSEHVKDERLRVKLSVALQLSEAELITSAGVIRAVPALSRSTVMFLHVTAGLILSMTVTVAVQVDDNPVLSTTVRVTEFWPRLAHVNDSGLAVNDTI